MRVIKLTSLTRWLARVAVVALVFVLCSSLPPSPHSPVVSVSVSVSATEVPPSAWDAHCQNSLTGSEFIGFSDQAFGPTPAVEFTDGGAAMASGGLSWSACTLDEGNTCYVCDRPAVDTAFEWATHCTSLAPPQKTSDDFFGNGRPAWANGGLSWSACSSGKEVNGQELAGRCYVCDRSSVGTPFEWATDCFMLGPAVTSEQSQDLFGSKGAAFSSDALSWSACSANANHNGLDDAGLCYICDRPDVDTDFVWADHCYDMGPAAGVLGKYSYLGYRSAWGNGALSWSVCAANAAVGSTNNAGMCYLCTRADAETPFKFGDDCQQLALDNVVGTELFGNGGPAWDNGGLLWSACAYGVNNYAGECYVCERTDAGSPFDRDYECYSLAPPDVAADDNFGEWGPTWGNDGLSWSACSYGANISAGKCYTCARTDAGTRFNWDADCHSLAPAAVAANDKFGFGGLTWGGSVLQASSCAGKISAGPCYFCEY